MKDKVYWRFKGEKEWRLGFPSDVGGGLVRMGFYRGADRGPIVDPDEIETR